jgi:hypothetical protein
MMVDPTFQAQRAKAGNPVHSESSVTPEPDGGSVITVSRLMAVDLPGMLQKLIGDKINIFETQTWRGAQLTALRREGVIRAGMVGQPGGVDGTLLLEGTDSGTTVTVEAEIKANVPLVGARVESFVADMLAKFMTKEQEIGRAWLADST